MAEASKTHGPSLRVILSKKCHFVEIYPYVIHCKNKLAIRKKQNKNETKKQNKTFKNFGLRKNIPMCIGIYLLKMGVMGPMCVHLFRVVYLCLNTVKSMFFP